MKLKIVITFVLFCVVGTTSADFSQKKWQWQTTPNKWKEPRNFLTLFEKRYENYLLISHQPKPSLM
jgi:hypothetical protein